MSLEHMKDISEIITVNQVRDISAKTKDEVLVELCNIASDTPNVTDPEGFLKAIRDREKVMSTGIGLGIAIPHAETPSVKDFVIAVGRCKKGIDFESLDGLPVHIIIFMGAPERKRKEFLKLMAKIGTIFNKSGFKERFLDAESSEDIFRLFVENIE